MGLKLKSPHKSMIAHEYSIRAFDIRLIELINLLM